MRKITTLGTISLLIFLLLSSIIGCQEKPTPAKPSPSPTHDQTPATLPTPTPPEPETVDFSDVNREETDASNLFYELLKLVPAAVKNVGYVILVDYASFRQDNNISLSTIEDYIEDMVSDEAGNQLLGTGAYITGNSPNLLDGTIQDEYVGYNLTDVDAEIQACNPPYIVVGAIGRFDPQATRDALSHQDKWPSWVIDAYTIEEYSGVTIYGWGDGTEVHIATKLVPPHIDSLGRARVLVVSEKHLFSAARVPDVKLLIDSSQDKVDSLADVPEFVSLVDGLSDLGAYAAVMGYPSLLFYELLINSPHVSADEIVDTAPKLKEFTAFGSGLGRDDKGLYTAIVLVHESSDIAVENVSLLEQRIENATSAYSDISWSEIITDVQVHVEENVLLAQLYTEHPDLWIAWAFAKDNLLLYEQE